MVIIMTKKFNVSKMVSLLLSLVILSGCTTPAPTESSQGNTENNTMTTSQGETELLDMSWEEIVETAKGTTVTFYGWGGDSKVNSYITTEVANTMKEKYDITLEHVGMDISEILTRMVAEKSSGKEGSVDVVWINGENFYTAKEGDLLYGSFLDKLPNGQQYLDLTAESNIMDFGVETEGMEAPWGRAQLVFFGDSSKGDLPKTLDELKTWTAENPGKFTYPAPPEFTGSAFVRNVIMQSTEGQALVSGDLTEEEIATATAPAMSYLNDIKSNLWREGTTYPSGFAQLQTMYADGEIDLAMTYTVDGVYKGISEGLFPESTVAYTFDNGGLSNTHFLSISATSPNPAAALVLINELLSVELQAAKADPANWGDLSVIDPTKLTEEEKSLMGDGVLLGSPLPETHASLIETIDTIWTTELLS